MRSSTTVIPLAVGLACIAAALTLNGDPLKSRFSRHQKAYYLPQDQINFVRPGIVFKIAGVQIASDGTITATFQINDPQGLPLDMNGVNAPGPVKVGMTLATIYNDGVSEQYESRNSERDRSDQWQDGDAGRA